MEQRFGDFLKSLRTERGFTLRQVEEIAKISNAYLSQIERGERGIPHFNVLKRLADAYGVPVTRFVDAAGMEAEGKSVKSESSAPDVAFVSRGYEKLSENNKRHLKEFLQHLIQKEHKRKQKR